MAIDRVPAPVPRSPGEICERIRSGGAAVVALSGGVDSAVVAALAVAALGDRALAVTLEGAAVSVREVEHARELARSVGIEHVVTPADPLELPAYRANGADRCYHCRTVEGRAVRRVAEERGIDQLLDGIHSDDLSDDRPGIRAMDEAGFFHPLLWAGWSKARVRSEARTRNLPNWDRPSDACLASRVARGEPISADLLRRVDAAESILLGYGFRRVRVRARGGSARVEVDRSELPRLTDTALAARLVSLLNELGFSTVEFDPNGYRGAPLSSDR